MHNGMTWTNGEVSHMYCGLHLVAISQVYINLNRKLCYEITLFI